MQHREIIQSFIDKLGATSYLELGVFNGDNFLAINCLNKTAVDFTIPPCISLDDYFAGSTDDFFAKLDGRRKFQVIFIDASHIASDVERDIVNAYKHLAKDGVILVHDVWPPREEVTKVPRETKEWCGTVYQAWHGLVWNNEQLMWELIKDDYGIGVIFKDPNVKLEAGFVSDISFDEYKALHA